MGWETATASASGSPGHCTVALQQHAGISRRLRSFRAELLAAARTPAAQMLVSKSGVSVCLENHEQPERLITVTNLAEAKFM